MTKRLFGMSGLVWAASLTAMVVVALPVSAQDTLAEARIRRMEAEIRALQGKVFPGDGRVFTSEIPARTAATTATGAPATTPVNDLTARVDAMEAQMQRITSQVEENGNRLRQIEARLAPVSAAATPTAEAAPSATVAVATPAPSPVIIASPAPAAVPTPAATTAAIATPASRQPAATRTPAATATRTAPSAQRLAAVRAIPKPKTDDAGDDDYSYGYRLWEAKFYPEARQQLNLMIDKYPRHARLSYARNLMGRAFLDDGNPREAATWFLNNYNETKKRPPGPSDRAPDSLLLLAESMNRLKDTNRACIALAEFADSFPREAAGRLKGQYDTTRAAVTCN